MALGPARLVEEKRFGAHHLVQVRGLGWESELIDYNISMVTDEDPLRGLLFY